MKFNCITFVVTVVLFCGCEKRKYPEEKIQLETEDIFCEASFGGEPINLKIGTDGYYCYSSYDQRDDSIYVFAGELKKYDCNPCSQALKVELFDYRKRSPVAGTLVDSAFRTGHRNFIPPVLDSRVLYFNSHPNKTVSSVSWSTSNGISTDQSVLKYECVQTGTHSVSLTVKTDYNCESMVVNRFYVGNNNYVFATNITLQSSQNTKATFSAHVVGGKGPFTYAWNFGDGSISSLEAPEHNFLYAGAYPVKLVIKDADQKSCEASFIHIAGNDLSSCASNISIVDKGIVSGYLDKVRISWTDQMNVVFRSDNLAQPAESYFEIINSQAYESNDRGESGRLLTVRFNVLLSDGTKQVWFKSEKTSIAVTYK
jgi:hypothetical protein